MRLVPLFITWGSAIVACGGVVWASYVSRQNMRKSRELLEASYALRSISDRLAVQLESPYLRREIAQVIADQEAGRERAPINDDAYALADAVIARVAKMNDVLRTTR